MSESDPIYRRRQVESIVGIKRSAIYDNIRRGDFPAPIQISARAVGWRKSAIDAFLASRPAAGRKAA
jgi:prophage regulatory protein